ncbi:hypothetical protein [Spiroplasma endosymbiont of Panorpa germanica]|uniref:hypothetical protein n=1 Tax=Spiroplasma endosymbiont of Panorpa germanica TaxID=3066314 RepID=UPI0030CE8404
MVGSIINKVVLKNSLINSLKGITNITITVAMIILSIISSSLLVSLNSNYLWSLVCFFCFSTLNIFVFDILNLNEIYANDRDLQIFSLEIRKGVLLRQIFFSRLLTNKIISIGVFLLHFLLFILVLAIKNPWQLNNFAFMIFLIPALDIIFTGFYLFIYSFKKNKLALSFSIIFLIMAAPTPLLTVFTNGFIPDSITSKLDKDSIVSSVARNDLLNLSSNNKTTKSFLIEGNKWNEIFQGNFNEDYRSNFLSMIGLKTGIIDIVDFKNLFNKFGNRPEDIKDYNTSFSNTLLFKINKIIVNQKDSNLSRDYHSSIIPKGSINKNKLNFSLNEFKKTIEKINNLSIWSEEQKRDVFALNNLIFNFGINNWVSDNVGNGSIGENLFNNANLENTPSYEWFDLSKNSDLPRTPVGLKIWNQNFTHLIINALNSNNRKYKNFNNAGLVALNSFIPWLVINEMIFNTDPYLNDYQILKNRGEDFISSQFYIYDGGSQKVNTFPSGYKYEDSDEPDKKFKILPFKIKSSGNFNKNNKAYSKHGYLVFLWALGVLLIVVDFFVFNKKFRI